MKAFVNTYALRTERLESNRLGTLAMIAHPLAEDGAYAGTILHDQIEVGSFGVEVRYDHNAAQADFDLAQIATRAAAGERAPVTAKLKTGGYLMLFVSQGPGGYQVVMDRLAERDEPRGKTRRVFDSAQLEKSDLFIVTLIRPGLWKMAEKSAGAEGTIRVAYPTPGKTQYRPGEPVHVKVAKGQFRPKDVKVGAAQGVVFEVGNEGTVLVVELLERDDGLKKAAPPPKVLRRVRWSNPKST